MRISWFGRTPRRALTIGMIGNTAAALACMASCGAPPELGQSRGAVTGLHSGPVVALTSRSLKKQLAMASPEHRGGPHRNSALERELEYVPALGFVDGTTCEHWPQRVELFSRTASDKDLGRLLSKLELPSTSHLSNLVAKMRHFGLREAAAIASKHRLMLIRLGPLEDGGDDVVAAVDPFARKGYLIADRWLCTPADLEQFRCATRRIDLEDAGEVELLLRSEPKTPDQPSPGAPSRQVSAVLLAAPEVHVPESLEVDVDLLLVARTLRGGDWPVVDGLAARKSSLGGGLGIVSERFVRGAATSPGVTMTARADGPTVSLAGWRQGLVAPAIPSLIAVACQTCVGLERVEARPNEPIAEFVLQAPSDPSTPTLQTKSWRERGVLVLSPGELLPVTVSEEDMHKRTIHQDERVYSSPITQEVDHWRTVLSFPALPRGRATFGPGGIASVHCGSNYGTIAVTTRRSAPLIYRNSVTEGLDAYIQALLDKHHALRPRDCAPPGPTPGSRRCEYYPDGTVYACSEDWTQHCREYSEIRVCLGAECRSFPSSPSVASFLSRYISERLRQSLTRASSPGDADPGFDELTVDAAQTDLSALLVSRGVYFSQLYAEAENRSLRWTTVDPRWNDLRHLLAQVPGYQDPGTPGWATYIQHMQDIFEVDGASIERVIRQANYVEQATPARTVGINALGLPYGQTVRGWYAEPASAAPSNTPILSLAQLEARWGRVADLVFDLRAAVTQQLSAAQLRQVVTHGRDHLTSASHAAQQLAEAAWRNRVDQTRALDRLEKAFGALQQLNLDFQNDIQAIWECPRSIADCQQVINEKLQQLVEHCEAQVSGPFDFLFGIVSAFIPVASGVLSAIDTVAGIYNFAAEVGTLFDPNNPALAYTKEVAAWFKARREDLRAVDKAIEVVDKLKQINGKVVGFLELEQIECEGTIAHNYILGRQTEIATLNAVLEQINIQLQTIHAVLGSLMAHLEYLSLVNDQYEQLRLEADRLSARFGRVGEQIDGDVAKRADWITAVCEVGRAVTRAALADLHGVTRGIESTTGAPGTSSALVIPAYPAYRSSAPASSYGFLLSLWDAASYQSRFSLSGSAGQTMVEQARLRFQWFVNDEICRNQTVPRLPKARFLVRKRLSGPLLRRFLTTGQVELAVDLDDMVRGGNRAVSGLTAVAARSAGAQSYDVELSAPVVLGIGYAACRGVEPNGDPCCNRAECVRDLEGDAPYLVNGAESRVPTTECDARERWASSSDPLTGTNLRVLACLRPVLNGRVAAPLPFVDRSQSDELLLQQNVDRTLCLVPPENIAFQPLRGLPLLGTWTVTHNWSDASLIAQELSSASSVPARGPSPLWIAGNQDVSAIEVLFFVAAEPRAASAPPSYALDAS